MSQKKFVRYKYEEYSYSDGGFDMARLPPLNSLRCFEAAARQRSFSKAALELNVTQSAVSHQVRLLEAWFGQPLFVRQGRQTVPTPRGVALAQALAEAFGIMQDACRMAGAGDLGATLTIAVLPSIATIWLIPRLDSFFKAHPSVPVKIVYLIAGQPLNFHDIDIAITWGPPAEIAEPATRFLAGDTVVVANPTLLERIGPHGNPQELLTAPLLHDTDRKGWQTFMRKAGIKLAGPATGPVFGDFNLLRAAALAGQGLALCPKSLIRDDVRAGRLVVLHEDIAVNEDHAYWIVEPAETEGRANAIAAFKGWLLDTARGSNAA